MNRNRDRILECSTWNDNPHKRIAVDYVTLAKHYDRLSYDIDFFTRLLIATPKPPVIAPLAVIQPLPLRRMQPVGFRQSPKPKKRKAPTIASLLDEVLVSYTATHVLTMIPSEILMHILSYLGDYAMTNVSVLDRYMCNVTGNTKKWRYLCQVYELGEPSDRFRQTHRSMYNAHKTPENKCQQCKKRTTVSICGSLIKMCRSCMNDLVIPRTKAKQAFFLDQTDLVGLPIAYQVGGMIYYYKVDVHDKAIALYGIDGLERKKKHRKQSNQK
jgi:hypothetical protein